MNKIRLQYSARQGFSLVEVLLSVALLALFITGFIGAVGYGEESASISGQHIRAAFLVEEGLEAVRNIRDNDFNAVTAGIHGLVLSGNHWTFAGTQDIFGIFTRQVDVSTIDQNRKLITVKVTWPENAQRVATISAETRLTDWR